MTRFGMCLAAVASLGLWLAAGRTLQAGPPAPVPYYTSYYYPAPMVPPTTPSPHVYVGARYSFYQPSEVSTSNYTPGYIAPQYRFSHYPTPGPYYYTPAYSYTPGYYSYYYTPGFFRY
ncbi:MAG: hypothetical protein ACK4RK_12800 [Gemmataceae bacterium]